MPAFSPDGAASGPRAAGLIGMMLILSAEVIHALTGTPHALWLIWIGVTLLIGAGLVAATLALIRRTPKA